MVDRRDEWGCLLARTVTQSAPQVERSFKEVLYRFLEEVHCTKAALYIDDGSGGLGLVARYGFGRGDTPLERLSGEDPLVVVASRLDGSPLVVNSAQQAPLLEQWLLASGAQRMLLIPLLDAGRMIGLVDAREKGGQQPFSDADGFAAATIGERLVEVARGLGLVVEQEVALQTGEPEDLVEPLPATPLRRDPPSLDLPAMASLAEAAGRCVARDGVHAVAVTVILDDRATSLVFSAHGGEAAEESALKTHQIEALLRVGGALPRSADWRVEWRRVAAADSGLSPALVVSSVPLMAGTWSMVLSVVGAEGGRSPGRVLDGLCGKLAMLHEMATLRFSRRSLARRLLEPGEGRFPELVAHSAVVSRLSMHMASALGSDHRGVEEAAIAGLLHDVGMRELDYEQIYRLANPRAEHQRVYRKHVLVGERILRGVGLETVADAVRSHHERWDGKGYPDRVAGEQIPWLARLVHAAEVFDVLTSASSYRAPIPVDKALSTIESGAGHQFDPTMVKVLFKVVE